MKESEGGRVVVDGRITSTNNSCIDGVMIILLQLNALHGERAKSDKSDTSSPPEEARNSIVAKKREEGETRQSHTGSYAGIVQIFDKKFICTIPLSYHLVRREIILCISRQELSFPLNVMIHS